MSKLFATSWTVACQAPLPRQEYWHDLPFPTPEDPPDLDSPDLGMEPKSIASPALTGRFFTTLG